MPSSPALSLPEVAINMALSADGKIALANRRAQTPGSSGDHDRLLAIRTGFDAVMSGARTVEAAPINLGPGGKKFQDKRLREGRSEFNLRIVVSGTGSLNPQAEVFHHDFSPVIVLTTQAISHKNLERLSKVAEEVRICGKESIHWKPTLRWLKKKWGMERLLCEGGGALNDSLFRARVVSRLYLTMCPVILGGKKSPTLSDGSGFDSLNKALRGHLTKLSSLGAEATLELTFPTG